MNGPAHGAPDPVHFPPPHDPEPMKAPQKREPVAAELNRGDVIVAGIDFPRGHGRRTCLVTFVNRRHTEDGLAVVRGRFRTNRGSWSTMERFLVGPYQRVQS